MKKLLCLLLTMILLMSLLAACGNGEDTSTDVSSEPASESQAATEESSEDPTEESSEEPTVEESSEEPFNFFQDEIDLEGEKNPVSVGKTYTGTEPSHASGQDPDKVKLTDGLFGTAPEFANGEWCGFDSKAGVPYTFVIDLGEEFVGIGSFEVNCIGGGNSGIYKSSFMVSVSLDGETWYSAGEYEAAGEPTETVKELYTDEITLEVGCTARYVKFSFPGKGWTFISELTVYAYPLA